MKLTKSKKYSIINLTGEIMNIKEIKNPKFLKDMNNKELEELSKDIREFLIESVSHTGGHLSSNLGIVELTICLHKVFDSPKDKIVFDVSHQSYIHKILTGRASKFNTLRQRNGLSGFQKRSESVHDAYEAGHSSTSLSAALGLAIGRDMNKEDNHVIAVIGDGSISNGLCYEALNQIGSTKTKLIIILNDNNMSISKNVGALHNHLDKIRNGHYKKLKTKTKTVLSKIPGIGLFLNNALGILKDSIKKIYNKNGFIFEELGIDYYGPIHGHDFKELEEYLNIAKKSESPVLIHVITEKGKGYVFAENDTTGSWHGVSPFDKTTGLPLETNDLTSWSEIVSDSLIRLMNKDIVVITPAMETGSKLTKLKAMFPNNFIDVGIAEEHALILANGLSLENKIPFVSIYSSFLQRGYDEILHDIARMNTHVIIGIDRCGIVGRDGETHQGVFDVTFLLPIPNLIIACPKDSIECTNMIKTAIDTPSPFCIRYSRASLEYKKAEITEIPIGSWEQITEGNDGTLITYGDFVNESIEIIEKLKKDGIKIELVNARFLKPIDEKYFKEIIKKDKPIFVYEESMKTGSLGSYLGTLTNKNIITYGVEDLFVHQGSRKELLVGLELDKNTIYKKIKKEIGRSK